MRFLICIVLSFLLFSASKGQCAFLTNKDVVLYQNIFELLKKEDFKEMEKHISSLSNKTLMGHILASKFLSKTYRTKASEIEDWFRLYADHPEATRIYALGKKKGARLPKQKPKSIYGNQSGTCSFVFRTEPIKAIEDLPFNYLSGDNRKKAKKMMNQIASYIRAGRTLNAKQVMKSEDAVRLFNRTDHDAARIALAFSYFLDGMDDLVVETAQKAVERSGEKLPLGYWTLGLSYWRQGKIDKAFEQFDKIANHKNVYPLLRSAGAYWASRSALKMGKFASVNSYLEIAAQAPRTFYGLLATKALGRDLNHTWDKPVLPEDDVQESFSHPAWERAIALKQIGQDELSMQELSALFVKADRQTRALLLAAAEKNGIEEDLALIAGDLQDENAPRYPAPHWTPFAGWKVDKALIFSFVKQESCFNTSAESSVGALGLMQLMPDTAKQIANFLNLKWDKKKLLEPEYNLSLGQEYILWLLKDKEIDGNLIFAAIAYNSGVGNLAKVKKKIKYDNDPLLFIESIPFKETRGFVERIMANFWIYRTLMNQPNQSLDDVIEGRWPTYLPQENSQPSDTVRSTNNN